MMGMTTHLMRRLYAPYIPKGAIRPTQNSSLAGVIPGNIHGNRKVGRLGGGLQGSKREGVGREAKCMRNLMVGVGHYFVASG